MEIDVEYTVEVEVAVAVDAPTGSMRHEQADEMDEALAGFVGRPQLVRVLIASTSTSRSRLRIRGLVPVLTVHP